MPRRLSKLVMAEVVKNPDREKLLASGLLSPREREVVERVLEGDTRDQIAQRLAIAYSTVREYLGRAYEKLREEREKRNEGSAR